MRKSSAPPADPSQGTLLPNTAIMLGSLQQSMLDLKGQVGQSAVDTQQLLGADILSQGDAIMNLINANKSASDAYAQAFADNIAAGFTNIAAAHNAEMAGLSFIADQNVGLNNSVRVIPGMIADLGVGVQNQTDRAISATSYVADQNVGLRRQIELLQHALAEQIAGGAGYPPVTGPSETFIPPVRGIKADSNGSASTPIEMLSAAGTN